MSDIRFDEALERTELGAARQQDEAEPRTEWRHEHR